MLADEVGRSLYEELDFRVEASNAAEFRRAHAHMPFIAGECARLMPGVSPQHWLAGRRAAVWRQTRAGAARSAAAVPGTMWRYTTRCVLVSEWVDGRSPSQLLAASRAPTGGDEAAREARRACRRQTLNLVRMGVQCSLAQLLVTGVMHGDPHSGNLLLRSADGRLCYLDFGLVVRVTPEHRQAMMVRTGWRLPSHVGSAGAQSASAAAANVSLAVCCCCLASQSALVHLGLGEWERLVADMEALDLLREGTNK